jgi:hypothetical protein
LPLVNAYIEAVAEELTALAAVLREQQRAQERREELFSSVVSADFTNQERG